MVHVTKIGPLIASQISVDMDIIKQFIVILQKQQMILLIQNKHDHVFLNQC